MQPVWEEPRALPVGGLSYRERRRLARLRPPIDDPDTAAVWWRLDAEQQGELMQLAALGGTAEVAHHAVVVAALQRQVERREIRWNLWQLAASLLVVAILAVLAPDLWPPEWWGVMVAAIGGGFLGQAQRVSSPRRTNERLARQGGHRSGEGRDRRWGLDRPMTGDPLVGTSLMVTGYLWVFRSLSGDVPSSLQAGLELLALTVAVGLVLVSARAVVRGARDG